MLHDITVYVINLNAHLGIETNYLIKMVCSDSNIATENLAIAYKQMDKIPEACTEILNKLSNNRNINELPAGVVDF